MTHASGDPYAPMQQTKNRRPLIVSGLLLPSLRLMVAR
jgi:hypothetical protein